jgi:murein DD-endopeptidase MepM/ murein hydrolase activator NlpD
VVVDIGHGRFAFYAHFQPNTLKVKVGDKVRRGQVLALLGNSGNSDAPHLHFGIQDGPGPFASNSLPYVFSSFTTTGTITNRFDDIAEGATAEIGPARAGRHKKELPLENDVITFPEAMTATREGATQVVINRSNGRKGGGLVDGDRDEYPFVRLILHVIAADGEVLFTRRATTGSSRTPRPG